MLQLTLIGNMRFFTCSAALYVLWVVGSVLLVFTGRFLKRISMFWLGPHFLIGIAVPVLSIIFTAGVQGWNSDKVSQSTIMAHGTLGVIVFIVCAALIISGIILRLQRKKKIMLSWLSFNRHLHVVSIF